MKKNIMTEWVGELRSDKYKQGPFLLKQKDENGTLQHCCLGVLCELYQSEMKKNKKKQLDEDLDNSGDAAAYSFDQNETTLPEAVRDWSGLHDCDGGGGFPNTTGFTSLADMNDRGASFETIANFIEKEWEKL
jgi:hypothetical protein